MDCTLERVEMVGYDNTEADLKRKQREEGKPEQEDKQDQEEKREKMNNAIAVELWNGVVVDQA
jgi:F0F1-type ATP synthase assembly protein I